MDDMNVSGTGLYKRPLSSRGNSASSSLSQAGLSISCDADEAIRASSSQRDASGKSFLPPIESHKMSTSKSSLGEQSSYSRKSTTKIMTHSSAKESKSMYRPKIWSIEVENAFRLQLAGYKDMIEYLEDHTPPELWNSDVLIKCLQAKKTGYFMYFRQTRECDDKHLNRVIMYT